MEHFPEQYILMPGKQYTVSESKTPCCIYYVISLYSNSWTDRWTGFGQSALTGEVDGSEMAYFFIYLIWEEK